MQPDKVTRLTGQMLPLADVVCIRLIALVKKSLYDLNVLLLDGSSLHGILVQQMVFLG